MISVFAQTEYTPPSGISMWLECAFWFMAFIAACAFTKSLLWPRRDKGLPQPLEIQNAKRLATHEELEQAKREWKERYDALERRAREFRERTEKKLGDIDRHVEGVPHRVIALLKDTKGLI